jgi:hypothetical protein
MHVHTCRLGFTWGYRVSGNVLSVSKDEERRRVFEKLYALDTDFRGGPRGEGAGRGRFHGVGWK